ncbi:MAG: UDP-N-acetylmuramoyl-L-alanyl-D-glutamate--2,6-diaminopimelate ligase [Candidatus Cloacimonas sp.]|nr:UDP-N-acetylmuramoyl-L-alanyl-D-glutamate--2,6-diaminopimelate ligase [Candidatus Cloacimonas sp.]
MIAGIVKALQKHQLLVSSQHLEALTSWQGKMQTDNRLLAKGDIFVCIKGESFDGHRFIDKALDAGASLIVSQEPLQEKVPAIQVTDTRKAAALIAKEIRIPSQDGKKQKNPFILIGVTGTNGKTTISLMLYEALRNLNHKCGWIGTMGYNIEGVNYPTQHTTPDIIQLNAIFTEMADSKVSYVVMEVSSHALALDRVYGVDFDYCLFSNLSRDHLDFHGDMDSYAEAKYLLFERGIDTGAVAIVNCDDAFGAKICQRLHAANAVCHSLGITDAEFCFNDIVTDINHSKFQLVSPVQVLNVSSRLIGSFNVQNLGLVALTLHSMGFTAQAITQAIVSIPPVKGRIERVENTKQIHVFIDYAHTPDAIENLLNAVHELPHKRILCLIGAGGNRDKGKRPLMLKAALKYSDAVIVTDDNPRFESPDAIIHDIVIDSDPRLPWWIIRERKLAIDSIIRLSQPGDIVLICGKGHENYQEIEGVRYHFDDLEIAQNVLNHQDVLTTQKADDELVLPIDNCLLELLFSPLAEERQVGYRHPKSFRYLSSDSRKLKPGSVFFAIKGDKFDGHSFLPEVLSEPDNISIASDLPLDTDASRCCLCVSSPLQSMGLLCQKYLQMFAPKRIALTGSTGKTTTKELIARILDDVAPCLSTAKNENNLIGLCKTILRIEPKHRFAVFELGTNHFGEIAQMADIVAPDIGMILNVGPSHLEQFGDENGVFKEKIDLFKRPLALRIFPGDDPHFSNFNMDGISVGYNEVCNYVISNQAGERGRQMFELDGTLWQIPYAAPHYAINSAFAIVLGLSLGIGKAQMQSSLQQPITLEMRSQTEARGKGVLIVDCYNANPCSMQAALEYWQITNPELPHYAILGDMLELGESSTMYHQMIGAMLVEMQFSELITVGQMAHLFQKQTQDTTNPNHYQNTEQLLRSGNLASIPGDGVILLKASHGIHLEKLLSAIRECH